LGKREKCFLTFGMLNRLFIFLSVTITSITATAQIHGITTGNMNPNRDSLLLIVNGSAHDSVKVNTYHLLGALTAGTNAQLAIEYTKKGIELSKKNNYIRGRATCMFQTSYCYSLLNNLNKAVLYMDSSIALYKQMNRLGFLPVCYTFRADHKQKLLIHEIQILRETFTGLWLASITSKKTTIKANIFMNHS
jgi:hypothetical protein